jgi:hypothetical protein
VGSHCGEHLGRRSCIHDPTPDGGLTPTAPAKSWPGSRGWGATGPSCKITCQAAVDTGLVISPSWCTAQEYSNGAHREHVSRSTLASGAPPPEFVQVRRGFLRPSSILFWRSVWLLCGPSGANLEHGVGGREMGSWSAPGPQRCTRLFGGCPRRLEVGVERSSWSLSGGWAGRQGGISLRQWGVVRSPLTGDRECNLEAGPSVR